MTKRLLTTFVLAVVSLSAGSGSRHCVNGAEATAPIHIGSDHEPFVDDYLIERMEGATLQMQRPVERNVAIVHDEPWEGNTSTYHTVFRDGDTFRMYYRGGHYDDANGKPSHDDFCCYAESRDGIHWTKPELGLIEFNGSTKNNIILSGLGTHNLAPFKDTNPNCASDAKYKAVGGGTSGLMAFKSSDGIHWKKLSEKPVITEGAFDSLNIAFWDEHRGHYVDFHRDLRKGVRDIKSCTSTDFAKWSDPDWIEYSGAPPQHLYTNAITTLPNAPQILVGLPMRLMPGRNPEKHYTDGVTDCVLMTSRDGKHFHRWNEAFIRPGPQPDRWVSRNNLPAWGIVTTESDVPGSPQELSIYATEGYYRGKGTRLRRYTLRLDGFASVHAPADRGEMVTKPLVFNAKDAELVINFATSAVGSLRCEVQDASGKPIAGFSLAECVELFGDQTQQPVTWTSAAKIASLAGMPIRLRFVMKDADLYALEFRSTKTSSPATARKTQDRNDGQNRAIASWTGPPRDLVLFDVSSEVTFDFNIKNGTCTMKIDPVTGVDFDNTLVRTLRWLDLHRLTTTIENKRSTYKREFEKAGFKIVLAGPARSEWSVENPLNSADSDATPSTRLDQQGADPPLSALRRLAADSELPKQILAMLRGNNPGLESPSQGENDARPGQAFDLRGTPLARLMKMNADKFAFGNEGTATIDRLNFDLDTSILHAHVDIRHRQILKANRLTGKFEFSWRSEGD